MIIIIELWSVGQILCYAVFMTAAPTYQYEQTDDTDQPAAFAVIMSTVVCDAAAFYCPEVIAQTK